MSYDMGGWPAPYGIELIVDAFSALLLVIVTGASTAALLVARGSLDTEICESRQHLFYTAWLLGLAGLAGIACPATRSTSSCSWRFPRSRPTY
ncbi:MAG: hypothetical protein U5Q16_09675 [Gammaproteobacteria bacterium]|nr:hypothetical protein [Gammaproteobacteria bacterium]